MSDLINELRELTDEMEMPGFVNVRKRLLKMIEKYDPPVGQDLLRHERDELKNENASLRRKNELLCQTVERSVLLSRIEKIINGMESAPDADYYGEWDDGMYVSTPSDVLMYLNKALEKEALEQGAKG